MSTPAIDGFFDRTLDNLRRAWSDLSGSTRRDFGKPPHPDLPDEDLSRLRRQLQNSLAAPGDEVAARNRARALGRIYLDLSPVGRARYIAMLARSFNSDRDAIDAAVEGLRAAGSEAERLRAEARLRQVLEPPWRRLLSRFTALPEGMKFLVDMRAEMLAQGREDAAVAALAADLRAMLAAWFDVGLLELRRITWDSPAALLERLIAYEAVHAIRSWGDLKDRLDSDRRCFAYFHPTMPDEPLIFVEVALVNGMSDSIDALLDEAAPAVDPARADTAIFYSISNAQRGLAGISFGNFLIKGVVALLRAEFPRLKSFATLSPIPGFARWVDRRLEGGDGVPALLTGTDRRQLRALAPAEPVADTLRGLFADGGWAGDPAAAEVVKGPLTRLAGLYLSERRAGTGLARDPVAHFHLSNGARLERLNWLADRSAKGFGQSAGLMVNYLYRPDDIEANSAAYSSAGKLISSSAMRPLLRA